MEQLRLSLLTITCKIVLNLKITINNYEKEMEFLSILTKKVNKLCDNIRVNINHIITEINLYITTDKLSKISSSENIKSLTQQQKDLLFFNELTFACGKIITTIRNHNKTIIDIISRTILKYEETVIIFPYDCVLHIFIQCLKIEKFEQCLFISKTCKDINKKTLPYFYKTLSISKFVSKNIYDNHFNLVSEMFNRGLMDEDEIINYNVVDEDSEDDFPILGYYVCNEMLLLRLEEEGEYILRNNYGWWWGRCVYGQIIELDQVIIKIYQKYLFCGFSKHYSLPHKKFIKKV